MIFLTCEVSSSQGCELSIIGKELIKITCDDHIEIDIKLPSCDGNVEESNLSPPSFPSFLEFLHLDVWMQSSSIVSEAVEGDFPCGVLQDAGVEDVYVISVVS